MDLRDAQVNRRPPPTRYTVTFRPRSCRAPVAGPRSQQPQPALRLLRAHLAVQPGSDPGIVHDVQRAQLIVGGEPDLSWQLVDAQEAFAMLKN